MSDPNLHWDGTQWLRWNGEQWAPDPTQPPPVAPKGHHTGLIVGLIAAAVVMVLLIGAGGFWLVNSRSDTEPVAGSAASTSITTMPIEATQDSFTDAVGTGQKVTPETLKQSVTVPGSEAGLYGGTRNVSSCDRRMLVSYLTGNPDKAQAWASVLGIQVQEIPKFVSKLTPMLLRSDTLVTNHNYVNGRAEPFLSVLQAGTAVLVGRRGLPVVRCYCGNPLTPPPPQLSDVTYTGATWPGWNPQSVTVVVQNTTLIDTFVVVDVLTQDTFNRPAGTAGGADWAGTQTSTPTPRATTSGTGDQVDDVIGFLSAIQARDYSAADSYTTQAFRNANGSASGLAPGWGGLRSFEIDGATIGDTFVAVYTQEYWEGGYRQATYYVTKTGGTYIDGMDRVDTNAGDIPPDPAEDYPTDDPQPDTGDMTTEQPEPEYPTDYPEQYPDNGGESTEEAVG